MTAQNSIHFFEKYKENKKIEKLYQATQKKIKKQKELATEKYLKQIEKYRNDIRARIERQETVNKNRARLQAEKKAREIVGVKQTKKTIKKKSDSITYRKKKAYHEFQLYCRISRAHPDGFVELADGKGMCRYDECVGGHIYSKHNHPNIAFNPMNCRPITFITNKKQGDSIGGRQTNVLSVLEQMVLQQSSKITYNKSEFTSKDYYQAMYIHRKEKNNQEKQRLGLVGSNTTKM